MLYLISEASCLNIDGYLSLLRLITNCEPKRLPGQETSLSQSAATVSRPPNRISWGFSRERVGGMAGESEFNMCIWESEVIPDSPQPRRGAQQKYLELCLRSRVKKTLEEMKAAVNLCQQCQRWGVWAGGKHVFIIICHPSAEKVNFLPGRFSFFLLPGPILT